MDVERDVDLTDQGVRVDPSVEVVPAPSMAELIEAAEASRRAEKPPSNPRVIARIREGTPWGRGRAARRLRSKCRNPRCRAEPGRWCVKGARGSTPGHLCEDRPEAPE